MTFIMMIFYGINESKIGFRQEKKPNATWHMMNHKWVQYTH